MRVLREATVATVLLGPFVDDADGVTAETGLAISAADVRLSKNGGALAGKNEASASAHDALGYYACDLDATDTGTVGSLTVVVSEAGALPVRHELQVVEAAVYDALFASGATGYSTLSAAAVNAEVDTALADYDGPTKAELDAAQAAIEAEIASQVTGVSSVPTLGPFTATGTPTVTTVTCTVSATNTDANYFPQAANDGASRFLIVQSGDRKGEMVRIASSTIVGTTLTLTFDAMKAAMEAGDTFRVGGK